MPSGGRERDDTLVSPTIVPTVPSSGTGNDLGPVRTGEGRGRRGPESAPRRVVPESGPSGRGLDTPPESRQRTHGHRAEVTKPSARPSVPHRTTPFDAGEGVRDHLGANRRPVPGLASDMSCASDPPPPPSTPRKRPRVPRPPTRVSVRPKRHLRNRHPSKVKTTSDRYHAHDLPGGPRGGTLGPGEGAGDVHGVYSGPCE